MRISPRKLLLIALLISLFVVHVPLGIVMWWMGQREAQRLAGLARAPRPVMIELAPAPDRHLPIAVVDNPPNQEVPDKPSVQSTVNSKVKEETVATGLTRAPSGNTQNSKAQGGPPAPAQAQPASKPPQIAKAPPVQPQKAEQTPEKEPDEPIPGSLEAELKALQGETKGTLSKELARLYARRTQQPTVAIPPGGTFGQPSGDYLPGFKVGGHTYVNALANQGIVYFVELKRKFQIAWNPRPVLQKQIHQISRGEISAVWGVRVDGSGRLSNLLLIRGSGIPAYDAEARRTITASAPFSRPPEHLKEPDGLVYMAWIFTYYL